MLISIPALAELPVTTLQTGDFDRDATAVWGQGETRTDIQFHQGRNDPSWVIWTQTTRPGHNGYRFGAEWDEPGTRHLRIGFSREIPFGAALMRAPADVRFSVLRPEAPYPGEMDNDEHWLPMDSVMGGGDLHWLLPAQVLNTRAIRFSFDATIDSPSRQVSISGLYIFPDRVANLAPLSTPIASSRQELTERMTDGTHRGWWDAWSNLGEQDKSDVVISPDNPQWVMLFWNAPVQLDGLATVWTGFREAEVQVYQGPENIHPREALDSQWRSLGTHVFDHWYPNSLSLNVVAFDETVMTRALRLVITEAVPDESPSHMRGKSLGNTRVWLGELMALRMIGEQAIDDMLVADPQEVQAPIPVTFEVERPGYVTLVIDDMNGKRVRNLIADRFFEAGEHTVYWDGKDESIVRPARIRSSTGRILEGVHGINEVDGGIVNPGTYVLRGLLRDEVKMIYQTTVNHAGNPPWTTAGGTGRWLADHSEPSDALFLPGGNGREPMMILSARVAEAGDGVIWTDLDGKKSRSVRWLGGHWTGAYYLARDEGEKAAPAIQAYTGSTWTVERGDAGRMEVRISALLDDTTRTVINHRMDTEGHGTNLMCGLAARNGIIYVSLSGLDQLLLVDATKGEAIGTVPMPEPGGLAFDAQGLLLAVSGTQLWRYDLDGFTPGTDTALPTPEIVVGNGLSAPVNLALDPQGRIYVSERGDDHNVKVFEENGTFIRAIGTPGGPKVGPYDETRMHNPAGMSVDSRNRLWVVEADLTPKRVSVWQLDGTFVRAFYGPSQYGGGGTLDFRDTQRLYYARQDASSAMEFHVDWKTGDWKLAHIIYRRQPGELQLPNFRGRNNTTGPQWPIYIGDRQYMTNAFNSNPTNGSNVVTIWQMRDSIAYPVAAAGHAGRWSLLQEERFSSRWPEGTGPSSHDRDKAKVLFVWSDVNNDGQVQADEVTMKSLDASVGSLYVRDDLALMTSYSHRLEPRGFTDEGVPLYDVDDVAAVITPRPTIHFTSGGGEAIDAGEWVVLTGGPMRGYRNGELMWTYPSQWPGLHAGHSGPRTFKPGQLVATTRVVGQPIRPHGTDVDIWAINGDGGQVFLLTLDGLFVAMLGRDRNSPEWRMPYRQRGMRIDHVGLIGEHFWPTLIQPDTGPAVLIAGKQHSSIVTVEGLDSIRRLPPKELAVSPEHVVAATVYQEHRAAAELARRGRDTIRIPRRTVPEHVDANPENWAEDGWVRIDPDTEGSLVIVGDRLVGALRSRRYHNLLENTGESLPMLFKTGGGLDLMIGVDPNADAGRSAPAPGDQRLLMTKVKGKIVAVLYQPKVPGTADGEAHPFSSPWRTVHIDRVTDVSEHVNIAQQGFTRGGIRYTLYEWSVPLSVLGWTPAPGQRLRGDIGFLVGRDGATTQRVYWQNQATTIVDDIPSEAALVPGLWGIFDVQL